jgi:restriction endonuclease S subunit
MTIEVSSTSPLILIIDETEAANIDTIDTGAAYTAFLHRQVGDFEQKPLGEYVDIISIGVNPRSTRYSDQQFEYVDLREIDDLYGQILKFRILKGSQIGSNKNRFQKWDILFAKIMPSLANKKVALVTQDVTSAIASTEFIILRKKLGVDINWFYLFRALRSDYFTRQAVAIVTGDTGRQRISPTRLLELHILVPPPELQNQIGEAVEQEFTLRTLAVEQAKRADDEAIPVLGETTLRTAREATRASTRRTRHRNSTD